MKRDPLVLAEGLILPGNDVGISRPNANALIVGTSGCGKSTSVILPTVARMENSNPIMSFAKEADAYAMARYLESPAKGYKVHILNIAHPAKSTISFDPMLYMESYEDVEEFSASIVTATVKSTVDEYWNAKAKKLISSIILAQMMIASDDTEVSMANALRLFDKTLPNNCYDSDGSFSTELDSMFKELAEKVPDAFAVREYHAWNHLPFRTASCVRDNASAALSTVFPQAIREMMQEKPQFNAEHFACRKEAVIIITEATDSSQQFYSNLFYRFTERRLLHYAASLPNGMLPREVRLIFDDFACTAKISGFAKDISLFRAAGISALILLQSEQQLEALYDKEAAVIRSNCSVYAYFPGGFDDRSCEIVSRRMGIPYDDVLYAPMGKVFIMQSGRRPMHLPRYDTLHSAEYRAYRTASGLPMRDGDHAEGGVL